MKPIKIDLPASFSEIEILALADWHWSDPFSDHDKIRKDLDYIRTHDNVFCVLNGDLLDCAIKSSIGDCYGATLTPMQELQACVELFEPIAKQGKILCALDGNHEARHYRTNGINMTELMCCQLGIADRYAPATALLFIHFGKMDKDNHERKMVYTAYVSHGSGGGKKEGGKIQRLADLATIVDADLYIVGHTHLPAVLKTSFARPVVQKSMIQYCTKLFVNTSAKLNYGGYGEIGGFKPPCTDTPIIYLNGTHKEMRAAV